MIGPRNEERALCPVAMLGVCVYSLFPLQLVTTHLTSLLSASKTTLVFLQILNEIP